MRKPLNTIKTAIYREIRLVQEKEGQALKHALRAGRLLLKAKERVGHGKWSDWLGKNFQLKASQTKNYMLLATEWEAIPKSQRAGLSSIRAALKLLDRNGLDRQQQVEPEPPNKPFTEREWRRWGAKLCAAEKPYRQLYDALKERYRECSGVVYLERFLRNILAASEKVRQRTPCYAAVSNADKASVTGASNKPFTKGEERRWAAKIRAAENPYRQLYYALKERYRECSGVVHLEVHLLNILAESEMVREWFGA
jgi:hypothetical protein